MEHASKQTHACAQLVLAVQVVKFVRRMPSLMLARTVIVFNIFCSSSRISGLMS